MAIKALVEYVEQETSDRFIPPGPNYHFYDEGISIPTPPLELFPGHVYAFYQKNPRGNDLLPSLDDWTSGLTSTKPYFDNYPIFLALNKYGQGLNLKLIPSPRRREFIRRYLNVFMPVLKSMVNQNGEFLEIRERLRSSAIRPLFAVNENWIRQTFFSALPKRNFDFLVDRYNTEEMRALKLLDWPDVPKIGDVNYVADPTIVSRSTIYGYIT